MENKKQNPETLIWISNKFWLSKSVLFSFNQLLKNPKLLHCGKQIQLCWWCVLPLTPAFGIKFVASLDYIQCHNKQESSELTSNLFVLKMST